MQILKLRNCSGAILYINADHINIFRAPTVTELAARKDKNKHLWKATVWLEGLPPSSCLTVMETPEEIAKQLQTN